MKQHTAKMVIVYDGECPFCSRYVTLLRLRESGQNIVLINARESLGYYEKELTERALDLDEGMAVKLNDKWYHGHECINVLALLSTKSGVFNKFNSWIFRHKTLCLILYPIMRFSRNLTLRLLGIRKLNSSN